MDKILEKAFQSTFEEIAGQLGSYDSAVRLKEKARREHKRERNARNKKRGVEKKEPEETYCPIKRMYKARTITGEQYQAAAGIEQGYYLKTINPRPRQFRYDERLDRSNSDDEPVRLIKIGDAYSKWVASLENKGIDVSMCLAVIVHGLRLEEVGKQYGKRKAKVSQYIKDSLNEYVGAWHRTAQEHKAIVMNYRKTEEKV